MSAQGPDSAGRWYMTSDEDPWIPLNRAGDEIRRQERLAVDSRLAAEYAAQHVATFGAVS